MSFLALLYTTKRQQEQLVYKLLAMMRIVMLASGWQAHEMFMVYHEALRRAVITQPVHVSFAALFPSGKVHPASGLAKETTTYCIKPITGCSELADVKELKEILPEVIDGKRVCLMPGGYPGIDGMSSCIITPPSKPALLLYQYKFSNVDASTRLTKSALQAIVAKYQLPSRKLLAAADTTAGASASDQEQHQLETILVVIAYRETGATFTESDIPASVIVLDRPAIRSLLGSFFPIYNTLVQE